MNPLSLSLLVAALLAVGPVLADFDAARFIKEKCSGCHDERVYSRPDHRMQNLQQLEAQVRRCDANINTSLFDEDIATFEADSGFYDQRDAGGFIRLNALRLRVAARRGR